MYSARINHMIVQQVLNMKLPNLFLYRSSRRRVMSTKRKLIFFGLPLLTFGGMYYTFPELRYSYSELGKGFMRVFRVAWAGLRMAMIY